MGGSITASSYFMLVICLLSPRWSIMGIHHNQLMKKYGHSILLYLQGLSYDASDYQ